MTALFLAIAVDTAIAAKSESTLNCKTGPVHKNYGSAKWLVYSCNDRKSLAFVTPDGSSAFPFYFMMTPDNGSYRIAGEGTGNKRVTDAAYQDLAKFSNSDRATLIAETLAVKH